MAKQQILTIEDDAAIRRGIVDALQFAGYGTLQSGHGDQGLQLALQSQIDLILLDLVLPGRQGFEILQEVRRVRPTLPVIILTARGEETAPRQAREAGANGYLTKPASSAQILGEVAKHLPAVE